MASELPDFKFWDQDSEDPRYFHLYISIFLGILIYIILYKLQKLLLIFGCKTPIIVHKYCHKIFMNPLSKSFRFCLVLVGSILVLKIMNEEYGSLMNFAPMFDNPLDPNYIIEFFLVIINLICFLFDVIEFIARSYRPRWILVINAMLFIMNMCGVFSNSLLYAFQFVILLRLIDYGFEDILFDFLQRFVDKENAEAILDIYEIFVIILFIAGASHTFEELGTNTKGKPNDDEFLITAPLFDHIYMTIITLSTVGYGDLSPTSNLSKCMWCIFIPFFVIWYSQKNECIINFLQWLKWRITRYPSPAGPYPRALLIGNLCSDCILSLLSKKQEIHHFEIIILAKNNDNYFSHIHEYAPRNVSFLTMDEKPKLLRDQIRDIFERKGNISPNEHDQIFIFPGPRDYNSLQKKENEMLKLTMIVKNATPSVRLTVSVFKKETKEKIEDLMHWDLNKDNVVCTQGTLESLSLQNILAPGSVGIFTSWLGRLHFDTEDKNPKHIYCTKKPFKEDLLYEKSLITNLLEKQRILIGTKSKTGEVQLFPKTIKKGTNGIFLSFYSKTKKASVTSHLPIHNTPTKYKAKTVTCLCLSKYTKASFLDESDLEVNYVTKDSYKYDYDKYKSDSVIIMDPTFMSNDQEIIRAITIHLLLYKCSGLDCKFHTTVVLGEETSVLKLFCPMELDNDLFSFGNIVCPTIFESIYPLAFTEPSVYHAIKRLFTEHKIFAEIIVDTCLYKDLFMHYLKLGKVLLGIHKYHHNIYAHPNSDIEVKKDDLALIVELSEDPETQ